MEEQNENQPPLQGPAAFVQALMTALVNSKASRFCNECRRAREWSDWNLFPMPVGVPMLGGPPPNNSFNPTRA